jgi:hypothetical protein
LKYTQDQWRFFTVNAVNPIRKDWILSALQVAHSGPTYSWFLRANAGKAWNIIKPSDYAKAIVSDVTADAVWNYDATNIFGVEVLFNLLRSMLTFLLRRSTTLL